MSDEGWTHVTRKSRRNIPATPAKTDIPETFTPRTTGVLRPPEALKDDYDRIRAQWVNSPAHEALVKLVDENAREIKVDRAVCLGIGTFDPEDGAWEAKRAAYVQLCALETLTLQLSKHTHKPIDCVFQEPIFTTADVAFLTTLGHRVVPSPSAYSLITDTTLLFAVHLYRPIYAAALATPHLPAIFVGTGWDVWDTVTMEKKSDLENMRKMDEKYVRVGFPQDTASTAFSSTSIYFKPREAIKEDGVEEEKSTKEASKEAGEISEEKDEESSKVKRDGEVHKEKAVDAEQDDVEGSKKERQNAGDADDGNETTKSVEKIHDELKGKKEVL